MQNPIQLLDEALCSQIAAGEVLERPASAVKELIENAIDAKATRIEVDVEKGGKTRLCITDDGHGMSEENAKLAILRHATSKISSIEDLSAIYTLGFRGEALASMAAVSKMTIITHEENAEVGTKVVIEGAAIQDIQKVAIAKGTQICMRDLFFNTPARLKFLKSENTENRRIYEVVENMALSYPHIHFTLSLDGKIKLNAPPNNTLKDRALAVLGRDIFEALYPIPYTEMGNVKVHGLFSSPEYSISNRSRFYTFVNGRAVKDSTINSAVSSAYREFLHGKHPCVVLHVEVPHDEVDVNVHPTKIELRFSKQDVVFRAVQRALRQGLSESPWIGAFTNQSADYPYATEPNEQRFDALPPQAFQAPEHAMRPPWAQTTAPAYHVPVDQVHHHFEGVVDPYEQAPSYYERQGYQVSDEPYTAAPKETENRTGYFSSLQYLTQINHAYIMALDKDAVVFIDQHAAHERINYERLKNLTNNEKAPASQGLIFPLALQLNGRQIQVLEEYMDFFDSLGFQMDKIGESSYALRSVPDFLADLDYQAMIAEALDELIGYGRATTFEDIQDNILATMACHTSIRSGHRLKAEEVYELFRLMDETLYRSNCPHGRPVHFIVTPQEMEKRFKRT